MVAEVANVHELPYEDASFDLVYMIAVINEIPEAIPGAGSPVSFFMAPWDDDTPLTWAEEYREKLQAP